MASIDRKVEVYGNSPERIYVTDANREEENVRRHIARYEFAARSIPAGARILDCACGSGYGTEILVKSVERSCVLGVDHSYDAIAYAQSHHWFDDSYYLLSEIDRLSLETGSKDAVVVLETMEHVPLEVCQRFLRNITRWLRPGGVVVASSPMLRYRDEVPYVTSPYHVNEMPRDLLLMMFLSEFPERGWVLHFYLQEQEAFLPLLDETEGFCIVVARKRLEPVRGSV